MVFPGLDIWNSLFLYCSHSESRDKCMSIYVSVTNTLQVAQLMFEIQLKFLCDRNIIDLYNFGQGYPL